MKCVKTINQISFRIAILNVSNLQDNFNQSGNADGGWADFEGDAKATKTPGTIAGSATDDTWDAFQTSSPKGVTSNTSNTSFDPFQVHSMPPILSSSWTSTSSLWLRYLMHLIQVHVVHKWAAYTGLWLMNIKHVLQSSQPYTVWYLCYLHGALGRVFSISRCHRMLAPNLCTSGRKSPCIIETASRLEAEQCIGTQMGSCRQSTVSTQLCWHLTLVIPEREIYVQFLQWWLRQL